MEQYVQQLLADIESATENVAVPWIEKESCDLFEWKSEKEDRLTAPRKSLEEWTGIKREALPPAERLTVDQLHRLVEALKTMLQEYNCIVVFQIQVPDIFQYRVIRDQFRQESSFLHRTLSWDTSPPSIAN